MQFVGHDSIMLLLTNCEVHRGKYLDPSSEVRTEVRSVRKAEVQIFSRIDRTNWSIRALLRIHIRQNDTLLNYNDNLRIKFLLDYFHSNSSGIFSSSSISFKEKLSFKKPKLA